MKNRILIAIAYGLLFASSAMLAQTTCQNQICKFANPCFGCTLDEGFKCSVDINNCKTCTSSQCQGPDPLSPTQKSSTSPGPACGNIKGVARAIAQGKPGETVVSLFHNPDAPVEFLAATHGPDDLFSSGKLRNNSDKAVTKYRIGYFTVSENLVVDVVTGVDMNVPGKIKPAASERVPAQGVPATLLTKVKGIAFFVSSVEFDDGSTWNADVPSTQSSLRTLVQQKP